jgi:outer membrane protein assembly factor BamA
LALNYNLSVSLSDPALFGRSIGGALSVFAEQRSEIDAYVREGFGGEVSLTFRTPWDMPVTLSYELGRASTKASPASTCFYLSVCREDDIKVYEDPRREAVLGLVVLRNRQNSLLNPSRGSFASLEARWASALIGSDSLGAFTKVQGQYARYVRVGLRGVLSVRVGAGTLLDFERVAIDGEERFYVPPEHRFYSGGANSVRGYGQNELGPVVRVIETDDTGSVVDTLPSASGGTDFALLNVEWRSPLPGFGGRVQWGAFLDVGQVFDRKDDVAGDPGLRFTPGLGLRFLTGVGPIRLDLGYNGYAPRAGPLYEARGGQLVLVNSSFAPPRSGSVLDRLRLHFSVGQAF